MANLIERFHRELGREVGTDANPAFWAANFGCDPKAAAATISTLKRLRVAVERNGRLYAL